MSESKELPVTLEYIVTDGVRYGANYKNPGSGGLSFQ